ncbi:EAL domain-containing protein [Oleiagrimonas sp. C23AA]|nr:EAL domain-containing protein [Oleiagrimonas sp. C23AA]NII10387.1 EAL domain-containing protein [Oleiagrimonas sp. C23AA]
MLIVASQREDRRALFDALDGHDFSALYTARSVDQAHALLAERPAIDLVVIDFIGEARESVAFCLQLQGMEAYAQVPIIGLLAADSTQRAWGYSRRPPGVVEWLHSPVDAGEAWARVRVQLGQDDAGTVAPAQEAALGDYRFAFDGSEDELIISDAQSGQILEVNATFEQRSGLLGAQVRGRPALALLGSEHPDAVQVRQLLERHGQCRAMCRRVRSDGGSDRVEAVTRLAVRGGLLVQVITLCDRRAVEASRRLMALLGRLHDSGEGDAGVAEATRMLADGMHLDYVAMYAAVGPGEAQPRLIAQQLRGETPADAPDPLREPALRLVLDGETIVADGDLAELSRNDGFVRAMGFATFIGLPLVDDRHNVLGALLVGTRQRWSEAVRGLRHDALNAAAARFGFELALRRAREQGRATGLLDALTGLPNRLLFSDRLETTLREARRTGETFAVLFIDLDRFKAINDSLGHAVGDKVLKVVADRLNSAVRTSDTVARYAGDEFTVILRHVAQRDDVLRIADKIVRLLDQPLALDDASELRITASVGLSFYPDDASTAERLLKHADVAMYNAKSEGRNNVQAYVSTDRDSNRQRAALEARLHLAERNGELRVFYQPQVDTASEDIVGMEALVRWDHPELGMISPGFFIPLAEESGLIVSLGQWVLRHACKDTQRWRQRYGLPLRVGVNLSALQLQQRELPGWVSEALRESGLEPAALELEITESMSLKSMPLVVDNLHALRDLGCSVAIDDFGTGQASLDYLRHLPADRIKIDQSFVRNIGTDPDDEAIVRATIHMAHSLHREVVAEGVEEESHLAFLREHQCDVLQGFLFCRPLSAVAFNTMLAERRRMLGEVEGGLLGATA